MKVSNFRDLCNMFQSLAAETQQTLYTVPCSPQECHADETSVQGSIRPEHIKESRQEFVSPIHSALTRACIAPVMCLTVPHCVDPSVSILYSNLHYHAVCSSRSRSVTQLMIYMNT